MRSCPPWVSNTPEAFYCPILGEASMTCISWPPATCPDSPSPLSSSLTVSPPVFKSSLLLLLGFYTCQSFCLKYFPHSTLFPSFYFKIQKLFLQRSRLWPSGAGVLKLRSHNLLKMFENRHWTPSLEFLIQWVWGGNWECIFLTSS